LHQQRASFGARRGFAVVFHPERERSEQSKDALIRSSQRVRERGYAAVAMMNMRRNGNSVLPSARRG
jgi:hypothetical protein